MNPFKNTKFFLTIPVNLPPTTMGGKGSRGKRFSPFLNKVNFYFYFFNVFNTK